MSCAIWLQWCHKQVLGVGEVNETRVVVHQGYEFQRVAEESRHGGGENVHDASDKRSDLPELTNTVVIL